MNRKKIALKLNLLDIMAQTRDCVNRLEAVLEAATIEALPIYKTANVILDVLGVPSNGMQYYYDPEDYQDWPEKYWGVFHRDGCIDILYNAAEGETAHEEAIDELLTVAAYWQSDEFKEEQESLKDAGYPKGPPARR